MGIRAVPGRAGRIDLQDFTQMAFESVLRASEIKKLPPGKIRGPLIFGIIWWPDGVPAPEGPISTPRGR
jgi:hypothetical protein